MRRSFALAGIAALGASCVIAGTTGGASAATSHTEVISDCLSAHYKPVSIDATCGDANFVVQKLTYSGWTANQASGAGMAAVNNCKPNCSLGQVHHYPTHVVLSDPHLVKGQELFHVMTLTFAGKNPYGHSHERFVLLNHGLG